MKKIKLRKKHKKNIYLFLHFLTYILYLIVGMYIGLIGNKLTDGQLYNILLFRREKTLAQIQEIVVPKQGYSFTITWKDTGQRLIKDGVIDETKLAQALLRKDKLTDEYKKYLNGSTQKIVLTKENAHFWLDVLWGLGLANKNNILESGEIQKYGDASQFASTGGYTLGKEESMVYFSKYSYIPLNEKQQKRLQEIASNIYRPCCGNSVAFPDCNHGMAMLALVELMLYQNYSTEDIYKTALAFNSVWFPQTYWDIAYHFEKNGRDYTQVSPQQVLSKTFSSAMGYAVIQKEAAEVAWPGVSRSSGGCRV